jgi:hypothetical protein
MRSTTPNVCLLVAKIRRVTAYLAIYRNNPSAGQSLGKCRKPSFRLLSTERRIAISNLLYELRVRIEEHDMEVLHGVNRLERSPVLEPNHLFT